MWRFIWRAINDLLDWLEGVDDELSEM